MDRFSFSLCIMYSRTSYHCYSYLHYASDTFRLTQHNAIKHSFFLFTVVKRPPLPPIPLCNVVPRVRAACSCRVVMNPVHFAFPHCATDLLVLRCGLGTMKMCSLHSKPDFGTSCNDEAKRQSATLRDGKSESRRSNTCALCSALFTLRKCTRVAPP